MVEPLHRLGLAGEAGPEAGVAGQVGVDDLDGRRGAAEVDVDGPVDLPHAAGAEEGLDAVIADLLAGELAHGSAATSRAAISSTYPAWAGFWAWIKRSTRRASTPCSGGTSSWTRKVKGVWGSSVMRGASPVANSIIWVKPKRVPRQR